MNFCAFWLFFVRCCAFLPAKILGFSSLVFSCCEIPCFFWGVFCLFSRVFKGKVRKTLGVFELFLGIFEKTKEKKTGFNSLQKSANLRIIVQKCAHQKRFYAIPPLLVVPRFACHRTSTCYPHQGLGSFRQG